MWRGFILGGWRLDASFPLGAYEALNSINTTAPRDRCIVLAGSISIDGSSAVCSLHSLHSLRHFEHQHCYLISLLCRCTAASVPVLVESYSDRQEFGKTYPLCLMGFLSGVVFKPLVICEILRTCRGCEASHPTKGVCGTPVVIFLRLRTLSFSPCMTMSSFQLSLSSIRKHAKAALYCVQADPKLAGHTAARWFMILFYRKKL